MDAPLGPPLINIDRPKKKIYIFFPQSTYLAHFCEHSLIAIRALAASRVSALGAGRSPRSCFSNADRRAASDGMEMNHRAEGDALVRASIIHH